MLGVCLTRQRPNKPLFARMGHLFGFVSVPHASFAFADRRGPGLKRKVSALLAIKKVQG